MDNTFNYIFKIQSDAQKVTAQMGALHGTVEKIQKSTVQMDEKFSKAFASMNNSIKTIKLSSILDQIERTANGINSLNKPGLDLSTSMSDLSAITGVTGKKLQEIEGYARANAKTFGGDASAAAESYKLILSQLSPEIGKVPVALQKMGDTVSTTSKLMGGDTAAATEVLTTAMNQYQVSTEDPIAASAKMTEMMNVMAAAAKEGSAELPQIKAGLEQSGMAAKAANVSFEESNSLLQILDKAGKKGSEGGVAFRNMMATMSEGRFLPKDVKAELAAAGVDINTLGNKSLTFTERMKPLRKIMGDSALLTKLFGKENSNAALALISGIDEANRLTKAITGTNVAYEQAAIVMESPAEKNKRLKASVDDLKISIFNSTNGLIGYASVLGDTARDFSNLTPLMSAAGTVMGTLSSKQKLLALWTTITTGATTGWTAAQGAFNVVMALNPIVWVVLGVLALIAVIAIVASKTEGWGAAWDHTVKGASLLWDAFVETGKLSFLTMVSALMIGINLIKEGWYKFKEATGIGDSAENQKMIAQINADTQARIKAVQDGNTKIEKLNAESKNQFSLAAGSIKWKKDSTQTTGGIAGPKIPGVTDDGTGDNKNPPGNTPKDKTNEAIATGGTKHNYITITIGDMIGIKANTVTGGKADAEKAGNQVTDELLRALAMATSAV